jgi:hypothetical protein
MKVCVCLEPDNPWIGTQIEDRGDVLVIEDENGIAHDVPVYACEHIDDDDENDDDSQK